MKFRLLWMVLLRACHFRTSLWPEGSPKKFRTNLPGNTRKHRTDIHTYRQTDIQTDSQTDRHAMRPSTVSEAAVLVCVVTQVQSWNVPH